MKTIRVVDATDFGIYHERAQAETRRDFIAYRTLIERWPEAHTSNVIASWRIEQWHIVSRYIAFRAILTLEESPKFIALEHLLLN